MDLIMEGLLSFFGEFKLKIHQGILSFESGCVCAWDTDVLLLSLVSYGAAVIIRTGYLSSVGVGLCREIFCGEAADTLV
jgi:hypothetical protein